METYILRIEQQTARKHSYFIAFPRGGKYTTLSLLSLQKKTPQVTLDAVNALEVSGVSYSMENETKS